MNTILKCFLIVTILVSIYGLIPLSFNFIFGTKANSLVIKKEDLANSCLYRDAYIVSGSIDIPTNISKEYSNIDTGAINLTGKNPFAGYDSIFSTQQMLVTGKVIALDTLLVCDSSSYKFAARFNVESSSIKNYYPRFKIHSIIFQYIFFGCCIFAIITILFFIYWIIQSLWIKRSS